MKIIASIEDPFVIDKILCHLEGRGVHRSQRLVVLEHARRRQRFARQLKSHGWSMGTAQGRGG
jgi:hypothetical protein